MEFNKSIKDKYFSHVDNHFIKINPELHDMYKAAGEGGWSYEAICIFYDNYFSTLHLPSHLKDYNH